MPLICYQTKKFGASSMSLIDSANSIIDEYREQGYQLTLRQLYYQFVSRDLLPNSIQSYNRLGTIVSDGRLAGLIDWDAIEDRTRSTKQNPHWQHPGEIIATAAQQYQVDKWQGQKYRPEVWVEKEALAGIVDKVCRPLDVPYLSCRGYTSQSEMWSSSQRLLSHIENGQIPVIIHIGDHDPSGIDMTRDIRERLALFTDDVIPVNRIALNMDQIEQYDPPPNPAKMTDSRFTAYVRDFGDKSWELDALPPDVLASLIRKTILKYCNQERFDRLKEVEGGAKSKLLQLSREFEGRA